MEQQKKFFEGYTPTNIKVDPLPVKVLNHSIWQEERIGHALDWSSQYLHQKSCPPYLISHLLGKILREISTADLSQCFTKSRAVRANDDDEVDAETVENVSYQPLRLMQMVTTKVDEMCLRYKEEAEKIDIDFPLEPGKVGAVPNIFGVSYHSIKNTRRTLEDRMVILPELEKVFNLKVQANYFAVFDGHNGVEAAAYSAAHLHHHLVTSPDYPDDISSAINYAFEATDTALLMKCKDESIRSGTTAVIGLIMPGLLSGDIYVAWAGDSQAILVRNSQSVSLVSPHKPDREDEMRRIKGVGGEVISISGTWRVNGNLAVSRAIGNLDYKEYVSSTPEITHIQVDGSEECLILACDGLFDVVSPQRCVEVFRDTLLSENPSDIDKVSQKLVIEAKQSGSGDNITVIVVLLKSKEDLRKIYRPSNMNGIEHPIVESSSTLESSNPEPFIEQILNPVELNMKLPADSSEPLIIPKSPAVDLKQKSVEAKSPKSPKTTITKTTSARTTTTTTPTKSTTLSASKSPAGARASGIAKSPLKTTERPSTAKVSPVSGKVGVSAVTKITVQKDTVSGVPKSSAPKPATSAPRTQVAPRTTLATKPKPPKTNETEKSTDPKTTLPPKTRPTTAPSNSRLTAAKAAVKNETSKIGEDTGKTGTESTTIKNRSGLSSARPTTASTTGTRVTQRPTTAAPTSRPPRPQTATLTSTRPATGVTKSGVSSTTAKPGVPKTTATATKPPATSQPLKVPPPSTKTQPLKPGVGKVSASQPQRKIAPTSSQPPPSKTQTRAPIKKPIGGDKKDLKVNGTVGKEKVEIPKKDEAQVGDVQVNSIEEKVVNGDGANVEPALVTKSFELAENLMNNVNIENENVNRVAVNESVEKLLFHDDTSSITEAQPEPPVSLEMSSKVDQLLDVQPLIETTTADVIHTDVDVGMNIEDSPSVGQDVVVEEHVTFTNEPLIETQPFEPFEVSNSAQSQPLEQSEFEEKEQFDEETLLEPTVQDIIVNDSLPALIPSETENTREDVEVKGDEHIEKYVLDSGEESIETKTSTNDFQENYEPFDITTTSNVDPVDNSKSFLDNREEEEYHQEIVQPEVHAQFITSENVILDQGIDTHESHLPLDFDSKENADMSSEICRDSISPPVNEEIDFLVENKVIMDEPQVTHEQQYQYDFQDVHAEDVSVPPANEMFSPREEVNRHEELDLGFSAPTDNEFLISDSDHLSSQLVSSSVDFVDDVEQVDVNQGPEMIANTAEVTAPYGDFEMLKNENPFTIEDPLEKVAEKQDSFATDFIGELEQEKFVQLQNPFTEQDLMGTPFGTGENVESKNPFGTEVISVDALNNQQVIDPFSNSFGGEVENPFYDEKHLYDDSTGMQHNEFIPENKFDTQQHDFEPFAYSEAVTTERHCFDDFVTGNEQPFTTTDDLRKEKEEEIKELSSPVPDLMAEINSNNIVNPTSNGVAKNVADFVDENVCFGDSVRLDDSERKTPIEKSEIINTKVGFENNSSDKVGDIHQLLKLPTTTVDCIWSHVRKRLMIRRLNVYPKKVEVVGLIVC